MIRTNLSCQWCKYRPRLMRLDDEGLICLKCGREDQDALVGPLPRTKTPLDYQARFWERVEKTPTCWLWLGTFRREYGIFSIKNRDHQAHRLAYEWSVGEVPAGHVLHHICEVPACVRPLHLTPMLNGDHLTHHRRLRKLRSS